MTKASARTSNKTSLPLVVAIEPDRRQAQQLTGVVCKRLHADLILAESAERALAELGDRVPHLILTSALLSPNDEVLLSERLRALDGAASHVQTLTIPVLAAAKPRKRSRAGGVLSVLGLGGKTEEDSAPEGCDPAVFAAQCAEYLERAVAEHAMNAAAAEHHDEMFSDAVPPIVNPVERTRDSYDPTDEWRYEAAAEPTAPLAEAVASGVEAFDPTTEPSTETFEPVTAASAQLFEPIPALSAEPFEPMPALGAEPLDPSGTSTDQSAERSWRPVERVDPVRERFSPAMPVFIDAPAATATVQEAIAQIEAFVARESLAAETIAKIEAAQLAEDEAVEAVDPAEEQLASNVPDNFIDVDLSKLFEDGIEIEPELRSAAKRDDDDDDTDVYDINVIGDDPWPDEPAIVVPKIIPYVAPNRASQVVASEVVPPAPVRARKETEVWIPARLGVSQLWPAMDAVTIKPRSVVPVVEDESDRELVAAHAPSKRAHAQPKPIQDEWGFFDPDQCGFNALLAKLDEILEDDPPA